jgi:hypothetical protein
MGSPVVRVCQELFLVRDGLRERVCLQYLRVGVGLKNRQGWQAKAREGQPL